MADTKPELYEIELNGVGIAVKTTTEGVEGLAAFVDDKVTSAGGGAVKSVNGKTGAVVLSAADVKALPDSTPIPKIPGAATTTADGLMSKADKVKLDGLKNTTIPGVATATTDGLMSKTDKAKLDAVPVFTFKKVGEA